MSGATSDVIATTIPTISPASTAPASEPMPPTTVTTKASASTGTPISGVTPCSGAARMPASPASAQPRAKTASQTLVISMPSTCTICGSRAPARITRPKGVRSMNSHRALTTASANPIRNRR